MKINYKLITVISVFLFSFFLNFNTSNAQVYVGCPAGSLYCAGNTNINSNNYSPYNDQTPYQDLNYQQNNNQKYPQLCAVLNRTVGFGEQGDDVAKLQIALTQEGLGNLGSTGYFGRLTVNAVKSFQRQAGFQTTGGVGPKTLSRMRQLWCGDSNVYRDNNNGNIPTTNTGNGIPLSVSISPTTSSGNGITIGWSSQGAQSCNLNNQQVQTTGTQAFTVTSPTTFTISCIGYSGNNVSKSVVVQSNSYGNNYNAPTVNVSISPTTVVAGQTATLYWTSTNAQYCTYNGQQVGTSGSQQVIVQISNSNFVVSCYGNGQTATGNINGLVSGGYNAGGISLSSQSGNSVTITVPTTSGTINWGDGLVENFNQIQCFTTPCNLTLTHRYANSGSYTINVYNTYNSLMYTLSVNITGSNTYSNPTLNINPTNASLVSGQTTTIAIVANYTNSCTISGGPYTVVNGSPSGVNFNGSISANPTTSTAYTVNCIGTNGQSVSQTTYITVNGPNVNNLTNNTNGYIATIILISNVNKKVDVQITTASGYPCLSGTIDWGDGQSTPYTPGSSCIAPATHYYNNDGTFTIRTYAISSGTNTQYDSRVIAVQ